MQVMISSLILADGGQISYDAFCAWLAGLPTLLRRQVFQLETGLRFRSKNLPKRLLYMQPVYKAV